MPYYDLNIVKEAARKEKINYIGRRVYIDIANLDYDFQDVISCFCNLTESHFKKTQYYNGIAYDEYRYSNVRCEGGEFITDDLYIKFFIKNGFLNINLASFHLSR